MYTHQSRLYNILLQHPDVMPSSVSTFVSTDLVAMSESTTTTNCEADFTEIQQNTKLKQSFQKTSLLKCCTFTRCLLVCFISMF